MSERISSTDYLDMYVNMCIIVKHAKELNQNTPEELAAVEQIRDTMRDIIVRKMEFAGDPYRGEP